MKLNKEFLIHNMDGESILVPTGVAGFSGLVRGNVTLGTVLALLKRDTTEAEIVETMKAGFDAPEGMIEADVRKVLEELRNIGALDE